jgi:hypothetical protein
MTITHEEAGQTARTVTTGGNREEATTKPTLKYASAHGTVTVAAAKRRPTRVTARPDPHHGPRGRAAHRRQAITLTE